MPQLNKLIAWLTEWQERIPLEDLRQELLQYPVTLETLRERQCVRFDPERYQRNLLAFGDQFYALTLCWLPGQTSPIHDHAGATCGVRVVHGTATETIYDRDGAGVLTVREERSVATGSVCASADADIHRLCNRGDTELVTLHVYSPYLTNISTYFEDRSDVEIFRDPLVEKMIAARRDSD